MATASTLVLIACLACGNDKEPGDRRYLNSDAAALIVPDLKQVLLRRIEASHFDSPVDLENLLKTSFVCRNCFKVYKTYVSHECVVCVPL